MMAKVIVLLVSVLLIVTVWRVFSKAGQPGWASLIPIYNTIVFLRIAGKPGWWFFLLLIPVANIVFGIMALAAFARNFGKGAGFVVGLIFLPVIFYPILAFGSAQYLAQPSQAVAGGAAVSAPASAPVRASAPPQQAQQAPAASDIRFVCSYCGKKLVVDRKGAGRQVPCPDCGRTLTIPAG
jgi:hypothetical protein